MQSALGQGPLSLLSLVTYGVLGFGTLGGSVGLTFGMFALIFQRSPELWILDEVTSPGLPRQILEILILLTSFLVLVPDSA